MFGKCVQPGEQPEKSSQKSLTDIHFGDMICQNILNIVRVFDFDNDIHIRFRRLFKNNSSGGQRLL